ncbi:MAG: DUF937 domain-containing protein [Spirochaetales bacterium]|nr:DUF937 domain-containing protein [Spirochaetales bacterium]
MTNFQTDFMKSMGPQVSRQLAGTLGINKQTANQIIPNVLPLILGGLKRQMETRGGADRANHILNKYGDPSVLDNLSGLFADKVQQDADPRLGGLLGDAGVNAADTMANKLNLDQGTIMKAIVMLAPVVLGTLSRKRDQGGLGSSGVAALIDRDGDGSVLDDVAGFLLQGGGQSMSGGGGLLGGFLSRLSKPRR